jgi:carboxypeptidase Taq
MTDSIDTLKKLLGEVADIGSTIAVLHWDQQTYMPSGGAEERAMQIATLSRLAHELATSDEMGAAIEAAKTTVGDLDAPTDEARLVRKSKRDYTKEKKVPSSWVTEFRRTTALAHRTWAKARQEADFSQFQSILEQIIDLRRQYADFFAPFDHPYDPLLDDYEPGMKTAEVQSVFDHLRQQQVKLVHAINEVSGRVDDAPIHQEFDEQRQWDFGVEVISAFGFDFERGRQDKTVHPFTTNFGIGDVRITTRFDSKFFNTGVFSSLHEAGHAMYEQGINPVYTRTPLAEGTSLSIHESQSRMWENLVGRSKPFWIAFYPRLQALFPDQLSSIDIDAFYRAVNKVEPSLIRVEADEATYNLHVMLRFEIETALLEGEIEAAHLPEVWNTKMEEYLGVVPPDDAQGVLQDVHWSEGLLGYFPTYALGNLVASQLWEKIEEDIPDLSQQIETGKFDALLGWLRKNVHQYGAKFDPMELLERITGSGLSAEPYLRYLHSKFGEIYGLEG